MLPHSTVAGIHFVAAVAAAYMFPAAVGIVAAGAEELEPFDMHYSPAVAVGIVAAAFVAVVASGIVAAAFVAVIFAWAAIVVVVAGSFVPSAVGDAAVRCIFHSAAVPSTPPAYPTRSILSPCSSSLSTHSLLPFHLVGSCAAPSYMRPHTCELHPF